MILICYTLLGLYAIPLFLILATFAASNGFTETSKFIDFGLALVALYSADTRETLGTFVVPFVTAYAVADAQGKGKVAAKTVWLFGTLTTLFLLSVVAYCAVHTRVDVMLGQTSVDGETLLKSRGEFLSISSAYVKELLVYISLVIGISQARKSETPA